MISTFLSVVPMILNAGPKHEVSAPESINASSSFHALVVLLFTCILINALFCLLEFMIDLIDVVGPGDGFSPSSGVEVVLA